MFDVTELVFDRLEVLARRVDELEASGDFETADFLRLYGRDFAHECQQEDQEFITIKQ